MKKTLIALAVVASAAVSGSAMAWTAGGNGGSIDIGGSLIPEVVDNPWEVSVGATVTDLDADIVKGQSVVNINAGQSIPVLGIRTKASTPFVGAAGLTPVVDYKGAIEPSTFSANKATLTLDVLNADGDKIGNLSTKLTAAGTMTRQWTSGYVDGGTLYAANPWSAFYGGLANSVDGIDESTAVGMMITDELFPGVLNNFDSMGITLDNKTLSAHFSGAGLKYSGAYASGILAQEQIQITLDQAADSDEIIWKASMPITVSYQ